MVWMLVCICMHVLCAWEFVLLCVCVFLCVRVCLYQNISRLNRRTLSSGPTCGRGYYLGRCMLKEETKSKFSFLYRLTSFNILDRVHPEVCNFVIYILLLFLKSPWYCRLHPICSRPTNIFHVLCPHPFSKFQRYFGYVEFPSVWRHTRTTNLVGTVARHEQQYRSQYRSQNTDLFSIYWIVF